MPGRAAAWNQAVTGLNFGTSLDLKIKGLGTRSEKIEDIDHAGLRAMTRPRSAKALMASLPTQIVQRLLSAPKKHSDKPAAEVLREVHGARYLGFRV